jgi:hypothetical protein
LLAKYKMILIKIYHFLDGETELEGSLIYTCKNGLYLDRRTKSNQLMIKCQLNGSYNLPDAWPICS